MNFEWDERKNELNRSNHGFDFSDGYRIFDLPIVIEIDDRMDYGEERLIGTFGSTIRCDCVHRA